MDTTFLTPGGPNRSKQIQDARDMQETVKRNAERSGSIAPPYEFLELIGKGSFGRVYKCRHTSTSQIVAVKILNIDDADFEGDPLARDQTIKDFRAEVEILNQLKDSKARNVNMIHDAFDLHSQLWIISDFCTGGSVRTLLRACPKGLEDQFIIPIARELAIALKSVHDIGVIHRDIKCANVYVTEDGRIQLGDFGVVGIMDNGVAKRTTIIGTPWYMPREMHIDSMSVSQGYGKEVDIWAFGCTLYEMATGLAPNHTVAVNMLGTVLEQSAPRLKGEQYSDDLCDFVAFCLNSDPRNRPTADMLLMHPYIAGTKTSYPTQGLVSLIDRYIVWEHRGGQRTSLWHAGGAAPVKVPTDEPAESIDDHDWNFSTTDSFYGGFAKRYSQMTVLEDLGPQFEAPAGAGLPPVLPRVLTPLERIQQEHAAKSANRGERSLDRIWNQSATPYDANQHSGMLPPLQLPPQEPTNDLPLREYSSDSAPRESTVFIDLDTTPGIDTAPTFNFDFENMATVKAKQKSSVASSRHGNSGDDDVVDEDDDTEPEYSNDTMRDNKRSTLAWKFPQMDDTQQQHQKRATMDWTWPGQPMDASDPDAVLDVPIETANDSHPAGFRPQLKHTATVPLGQFKDFIHAGQTQNPDAMMTTTVRDSMHSLIDLDVSVSDLDDVPRPSTAVSHAESTSTTMTSGNPFDLDDDTGVNDIDQNRVSIHKQWQSEGGNNEDRNSLRRMLHQRGGSLSSTDSEFERLNISGNVNESDYGYAHRSAQSMDNARNDFSRTSHHQNMHSEADSNWLVVGRDDYGYSNPTTPSLGGFSYPTSNTSHNSDLSGMTYSGHSYGNSDVQVVDTVEYPAAAPPMPEALFEDAPRSTVMSELSRLLGDAEDALKSTALALQLHVGSDVREEEDAVGNTGTSRRTGLPSSMAATAPDEQTLQQ